MGVLTYNLHVLTYINEKIEGNNKKITYFCYKLLSTYIIIIC